MHDWFDQTWNCNIKRKASAKNSYISGNKNQQKNPFGYFNKGASKLYDVNNIYCCDTLQLKGKCKVFYLIASINILAKNKVIIRNSFRIHISIDFGQNIKSFLSTTPHSSLPKHSPMKHASFVYSCSWP